ncbi:DUF2752 domain-containing protein [Streptomyces sp. NRRL WC-3549]|uniref:DUF2752 domain-containing protein n=1 Tax=Streptomyces sp. NRRL WC-3549 TaxID=1463925 RepID=UPI0004C9A676|nr:DUF2752 domain-containing protein [Streptomyces sp. NRRL WC-3549]
MDASASSPAAPDPAHAAPDPAPGPRTPAAPGPPPPPGPPGGPLFPCAPAPASRLRRVLVPAGVMAAVVGAFGYVAAVDPNEPGHYPVCPLLRLTGLLCPGCGGLRSAHAFAHGDLVTALGANAVAVVGYAVFAVVWLLWTVRAVRGKPLRIALAPGYWWGVGAVLVVFSVVRNLPFGSALAP